MVGHVFSSPAEWPLCQTCFRLLPSELASAAFVVSNSQRELAIIQDGAIPSGQLEARDLVSKSSFGGTVLKKIGNLMVPMFGKVTVFVIQLLVAEVKFIITVV
jgi:hypothetical protein